MTTTTKKKRPGKKKKPPKLPKGGRRPKLPAGRRVAPVQLSLDLGAAGFAAREVGGPMFAGDPPPPPGDIPAEDNRV